MLVTLRLNMQCCGLEIVFCRVVNSIGLQFVLHRYRAVHRKFNTGISVGFDLLLSNANLVSIGRAYVLVHICI